MWKLIVEQIILDFFTWNFALSEGSSKQGKALLASVASN